MSSTPSSAIWNVALWIGNDEGLYHLAKNRRSYKAFVQDQRDIGYLETPDGVSWTDSGLDLEALEKMVREL